MPLIIDIPLSNGEPLPYFDMQVPLEGATYTIEFRWNVRAGAWYMNVLDEQGENVLQAGLKAVSDWPLGAYTTGHQPPGMFVFVDSSGQHVDPALTDLGVRVHLVYYLSTEL